jgi:hypothetical protein
MKALQEHGLEFSAVAGTSAGGLCAIIWSTGRVDDGVQAWKSIDHSGFFGRQPEGCLRRLLKIICIAGKLFVSYMRNVEPEGRSQFARDVFFCAKELAKDPVSTMEAEMSTTKTRGAKREYCLERAAAYDRFAEKHSAKSRRLLQEVGRPVQEMGR